MKPLMNKANRIVPIMTLFLVIALGSCAPTPTPQAPVVEPSALIDPTITPILAYPNPEFEFSNVTKVPTLTPTVTAPPNTRLYTDPEGWFSVRIPANWKPIGTSSSFLGPDGSFETGYLPEMMFMQSAIDVCEWRVNINLKTDYSIITHGFYRPNTQRSYPQGAYSACVLLPKSGGITEAIVKNSEADYPHRFFYLKTDHHHFGMIMSTFLWLHPVKYSYQYIPPKFEKMPLRPEDITFWEKAASTTTKATVSEYTLLPLQDKAVPLWNYIPPDVPKGEFEAKNENKPNMSAIEEQLTRYGYELRANPAGKTHPFNKDKVLSNLYKNGKLLIEDVHTIRNVYTFSTPAKPIIAFIVEVFDPHGRDFTGSYLVQNGVVTNWERNTYYDSGIAPILYKGDLLWVRFPWVNEPSVDVQVQTSHQKILFSFRALTNYLDFHAWNDHWILEVGNFLIDTGDIINQKYGFEEAFDWHIVKDKPFYFFRKGQRVGMYYGGEFFPLDYEDVAHGFRDPLESNNPDVSANTVRFFAKRDDIWYYVIAEMK